jgi:protein SCO1/2
MEASYWDKDEIYNLGRKFYFVEEDLGENNELFFLHTENFVLIIDKTE